MLRLTETTVPSGVSAKTMSLLYERTSLTSGESVESCCSSKGKKPTRKSLRT
jgi:hypothetical protein